MGLGIAKITRASGKSNTEVIMDAVADAAPDTVFSYQQLAEWLQEGTSTKYDASRVMACVNRANVQLLKRHQRELRNVRGVGYKMCHANEHMGLALVRRTKADRQLERGILTLRNVRWDEMDDNTRLAHRGQLMLTEAVAMQVRALQERQNEHMELISRQIGTLVERLDKAGL